MSKAKYSFASDSADKCATICLDSSAIGHAFQCLSFDFCQADQKCAFYDNSHITDPSVNLETAPLCDHYSSKRCFWHLYNRSVFLRIKLVFLETVDNIDATNKETIYRVLSDKLVRGELDLDIINEEDQQTSEVSKQKLRFLSQLN